MQVSKFAREGLKGADGLESSIGLLTDKAGVSLLTQNIYIDISFVISFVIYYFIYIFDLAKELITDLAVIACECLGDDEFRTDYYDSYAFLKRYTRFYF